MKKSIVYLLILIFFFGVAGCGSESEESTAKFLDDFEKVPAFACTDLDGNDVGNEIFSGSKLTVINIWATG